jgi:hypothetical protein
MKQMWEILVPHKMNKKNISVPYHRVWDDTVKAIAGGLTILRAAKGKWVSPSGKTIKELMIPVRIACTRSEIMNIAAYTKTYYNQEVVLVIKISDEVIFYPEQKTVDETTI